MSGFRVQRRLGIRTRAADKADEVAIEGMVRDFERQEEAKKRYLGERG